MKNNDVKVLIFAALAIVINVVLGKLVSSLQIPLLFLDALGTIYIAANYDMKYAVLTGFCTNLLLGITNGVTAIPFALVSVAIAIIVSLISRKDFTLKKAIIAGILLSIVTPLIGTPIRMMLFGGFTGSGTDIIILALRASGEKIFASTFIAVLAANFVDKVASCLIVYGITAYMKKNPMTKSLV